MATDTGTGLSPHLRGVTVTTVATVLGMVAGIVAAFVTSGPDDIFGLTALGAAILIQLPLLNVLGVEVADFSKKDHLYVAFMTFVLWFMTWGILLSTGAFQ
jgi:uncharacterized membrane protein